MKFLSGKSSSRVVILHGGAHSRLPKLEAIDLATEALIRFSLVSLENCAEFEVVDVVVTALTQMEADPQFNAGFGGAIQDDGIVRVTAAVMNGARQSFSGVVNAEGLRHPSIVARALQDNRARVVGRPSVQTIAQSLDLPIENLVNESSKAEWDARREENRVGDTVGCVARDDTGNLAAGTSTGGRTHALAGRISDSATVAGNYASAFAAISTTGIGEEIVDDALAARIETRCRDGMSLEDASRRAFDEAVARDRSYGWIALSRDGSWVVAYTTPAMSYVVRDENGVQASSAMV